ncbi:MAG TPA: segregation/condensation protein A [Syntrophorhabdaceae bacterium]|jgi:segregation and condensation protein A|nr:segregation/condensation protein A [Syntrophorhabdaceae bacterium]HOS04704.1 segregation/condensation protein A [Syntrophorhabdaceae bacterium]HPL41721.1 segregation/condensation protein A [Syntrophorhabdaceae bacterium]HQP51050.1 segregation/condensation protein A [Syntrophorhabdaceae bacterium]
MSLVLTPSLDIKIDCYEGPLSVLIGLIKKNKVSIWDIQLSLITERFLEYVDFVQKMHLKIAEDFIDMASLLIYIKSKMLLPSREEDKGYDPKEELIERIIEYEKIRTMAESLNSLPVLYRDTFCREQKSIDGDDGFDLLHLCNIFFELMKRKEERFLVIREIKPTLGEKLAMLKSILDSTGLFVWNMKEQAEQAEKIATVLGMLELTKIKVATIIQRRPFGNIALKKREPTYDDLQYLQPADKTI